MYVLYCHQKLTPYIFFNFVKKHQEHVFIDLFSFKLLFMTYHTCIESQKSGEILCEKQVHVTSIKQG
jgi:hypothetical protein